MPSVRLDKPFQVGLRPTRDGSLDDPFLQVCTNAIPTADGCVPVFTGVSSIPSALTTTIDTTLGITRTNTSPQLFRGRAKTFLAMPTALWILSESDWSAAPLRPIAVTASNLASNGDFLTNATGWTLGGSWQWQFDPSAEAAFRGHLKHTLGTGCASQAGILTNGVTYFVSVQARSTLSSSTLTLYAGTNSVAFTLSDKPRTYSGFVTANGSDFEIATSVGASPAITNVEIYPVASIPSGGLWSFADFGDVYVFANGSCTLFTTVYSQGGFPQLRTYIDTSLNPNTVANFRGRLLMGGFQGQDTWRTAWDTFWGQVAGDTGTTSVPTDNLSPRHIWWSSIAGEDMFQHFLPETLLERPQTTTLPQAPNIVSNPYFLGGGGAPWELPSDWTIVEGEYIQHTGGSASEVTQQPDKMATPPALVDLYDVTFQVTGRTAGSVTLKLGDTSVVTATANGHHLGRGAFTTSLIVKLAASSSFDGKISNVVIRPVATPGYAEDLWLLGEQGHRALPWQGAVLSQHSLGASTLVGTADGLIALTPTGSTFGFTPLHDIGLAGRRAIGGSSREALFVDRQGTLWRVNADLGLTREGREEFLLTHLDAPGPVVHYNPDRDEYYIGCADGVTYIVTRTGVGMLPTTVLGCHYLEGVWSLLTQGTGSDLSITLRTDILNLGSRGVKTLRELELLFEGTAAQITLETRMSSNGAWNTAGPFTLPEAARIIYSTSFVDLRITITFPFFTNLARLTALNLTFDVAGRTTLRDTLDTYQLL